MVIIDLIILFITIRLGFKCIKKLNEHYPVLPVKLFKYLLLYHTFFTFIYFLLTKVQPADAKGYYARAIFKFRFGTNFIDSITYVLSDILQLSFLSTFWVFGLMGFFWLPIMYISIRENMLNSKRLIQILNGLLFVPGFSFWTAHIGKDGLMALGISCVIFSLNRISIRKKWFFFGVFLTFMIRPHISAVLLLAVGLGILFHFQYFRSKFVLVLVFLSAIIGPLLVVAVFKKLGFKITSIGDMFTIFEMFQQFQAKWQQVNLRGGSQVDITKYPFILKVVTFLYRPLFVDAKSVLMMAASCENVIYILLTIFSFHRYVIGFLIKRKSLFFTVNVLFCLMFVVINSLIITNMGLAARLKIMIVPSLIGIVFISQSYNRWIINRKKA